MYARVNLAAAGRALFAVLAALPALAAADDSPQAVGRRWIPSLAATSGVFFQTQDASVESSCELGALGDGANVSNCSGTRPVLETAPLRPSSDDDMWAVSPYVGVNVQLMTPQFYLYRYPVRLFVSGEMVANFATSRNIASEGDPTGVTIPEGSTALNEFPAKAFLGVGSRTTAQLQTLSWGADVGLVLPLRFQGRELRIKPSFGWARFGIDVDGVVLAGVKDDLLPGTVTPSAPFGCVATTSCLGSNAREINLTAEDSRVLNAIGGGFEIEMDAGRFGAIGATVFLGGHVYSVLGDRSVSLSADTGRIGQVPQPDDEMRIDSYSAKWEFEADALMYRAGVGVRFHWLGF